MIRSISSLNSSRCPSVAKVQGSVRFCLGTNRSSVLCVWPDDLDHMAFDQRQRTQRQVLDHPTRKCCLSISEDNL
jgi:hypothetical protein